MFTCSGVQRHTFKTRLHWKKQHDAAYLGNNLNSKLNYAVNVAREVSQRIQDTKRFWLKLDPLWKDRSSHPKRKLLIYDAAIQSKLLYGLETVPLAVQSQRELVNEVSVDLGNIGPVTLTNPIYNFISHTNNRVCDFQNESILAAAYQRGI